MNTLGCLMNSEEMKKNRRDFYFNLPSEIKKKYLEDENIMSLFSGLPENIKDILVECFLNGIHLKNHTEGALVYNYFGKHSRIIQDLRIDPGTDSMLRRIYVNMGTKDMYYEEKVESDIDRYFFHSLSGQALRNRFEAIVHHVPVYLRDFNLDSKEMLFLNLGSGSAGDIITILDQNQNLRGMNVCCVDIDECAIKFGEKFSERFPEITFLKKSMVRLSFAYNNSAIFGLLIGILCGLDYENCVKLLCAIKRYFKPGALLMSAALTEKMAKNDLFCAYILYEMAGWNLQFAPFGRLQMAYKDAGYEIKDVVTDSPTDFYEIVVAKVI